MNMRKEKAMKLGRSPLVLVLSQVRFSPVALMEEFVPRIQEGLRKEGFVWFDEEQMQEVSLGPKPVLKSGKRWVFATRDRDEAIVLAENFLVYETSQYDVFETFTGRLGTALKIAKEQAEIALSDRIGLRYVDLLREIDGKSPRDLLKEPARGLTSDQLGTEECRHRSLTKATTPFGKMNVQILENSGGQILPPDLVENSLNIDVRPDEGEAFRILDIDHFSVQTRDFDPDVLIQDMWALHEYTDKAFRAAVTEEAIEIWRQEARE